MKFELCQRFYFEAAHSLDRDPSVTGASAAVASRRVHGHTYHAEACMSGHRDPESGMVADLAGMRLAIDGLRAELDHRLLDDVAGLGPATLENLCAFIWHRLETALPALSMVTVERQASGDRCTLRRSD